MYAAESASSPLAVGGSIPGASVEIALGAAAAVAAAASPAGVRVAWKWGTQFGSTGVREYGSCGTGADWSRIRPGRGRGSGSGLAAAGMLRWTQLQ
ncbi:hypothetical protein Zmor_003132 [Zophobas morio]|uniref:Uncharacterized protein n=1 Tax=Zophobas morio TaxID=2755281 RepID=A0AA38HKW1_9CUCU|nr:hypothetical protein Zmor_003132 [Zophobas morio]